MHLTPVQLQDGYSSRLEDEGVAVVSVRLDAAMVSRLLAAVASVQGGDGVRRRGDVYGIRGLFRQAPAVRELLDAPLLHSLLAPILGPKFFAVSGTLFNKTPRANWKVAWHQDLSIAVHERVDIPGFGPWSTKAGALHVQPPVTILERMLALRFHLDDCGADNGALRVILGSHRLGRLSTEMIREATRTNTARVCAVPAGGIVVMRPLCLHASSSTEHGLNRRVIHVEFAAHDLPHPMEWREVYRPIY